jgi:hypothetical protein
LSDAEFEKIFGLCQDNLARSESPLRFPETQSAFIRVHNETLSVAAMCVSNPVNVSRRMRANHGANPKGSKEGRRMNDTQTLLLIHTVAWPILIWALSKTWSSSRNAVRFSSARTMKRPLIRV